MRIIVLGYVMRGLLGGFVWGCLQYVMGLAKLGHDIYFVEYIDDGDTGFSNSSPIGSGALPFSTVEQWQAAVQDIPRRWDFHYFAAREIAEEYFPARKGLLILIERALSLRPGPRATHSPTTEN